MTTTRCEGILVAIDMDTASRLASERPEACWERSIKAVRRPRSAQPLCSQKVPAEARPCAVAASVLTAHGRSMDSHPFRGPAHVIYLGPLRRERRVRLATFSPWRRLLPLCVFSLISRCVASVLRPDKLFLPSH